MMDLVQFRSECRFANKDQFCIFKQLVAEENSTVAIWLWIIFVALIGKSMVMRSFPSYT